MTEYVVGLTRLSVLRLADDRASFGFDDRIGWQISGENWMLGRIALPEDWPFEAVLACEFFRALRQALAMTPAQVRLANLLLRERLGEGSAT